MDELAILRKSFIAFLDGLWWGLRDTVGALSMNEGYASGFKQIGKEIAKSLGGHGPSDAAKIAVQILSAIGLEVELQGTEFVVKSCPLWDRIRERGLEYAFHVEEICWRPLLEGIGEIVNARPKVHSSLRLAYVARAKAEYKKSKVKKALDAGTITTEEYQKQTDMIEKSLKQIVPDGRYGFE